MRLRKHNSVVALLAVGGCFALAGSSSAQLVIPGEHSISTYAYAGAGDISLDGSGYIALWAFANDYSNQGHEVATTGSHSWTGYDASGNVQTMTFTGTGHAAADYGTLHASASGTIENIYGNPINPIYYGGGDSLNEAGSPKYLQSVGQAVWTDTLQLNPFSDPIVKIRYLFHVEGTSDAHSYAFLAFGAGDNSTVFFSSPDVTATDWATPEWDVTPGAPIVLNGNFGAVFGANTQDYPDLWGQTISGEANFYDTLKLTGIELLDANGNVVNGATYATASGAHYNVIGGTYEAPSSAVPEPGSLAIFAGLGVSGLLFRRRNRRARS